LLATLALRLRGEEVYSLDIVDLKTPRPQWLENFGGKYIDSVFSRHPADERITILQWQN
jgi:hypothetical protein